MNTRQLLDYYVSQAVSLLVDEDTREYASDQAARLYNDLLS